MPEANLSIDLAPILVVVGLAITMYEIWGMLGLGIALLVLGIGYAILDAISRDTSGDDA